MRWEDERYVRLYTRDTVDWLGLSFEAQGLLALLLRKVDRAGIIRLGRHGRKGVAAIVGHATRWPTIEPALQELLDDGCVCIEGDTSVIPNFVAAQEAATSDAQRQRDKRERDRDKALAGSLREVTQESHAEVSRPEVTQEGHAGDVTPNQPSLPSQPNQQDQKPLSAETAQPAALPVPVAPKSPDQALQVFAHWCKVMGKGPRAVFDRKRRTAVTKQLEAGRTVEELCRAVDGCSRSAWNMGANDRATKFNDLALICRDAANVEKFMELADSPARALGGAALLHLNPKLADEPAGRKFL